MTEPKISIIIPVYNAEEYLKQCLDSLVNQSLEDIEILCVDDKSPDNSRNIIEAYSKKDERVKYISMEKNSGSGLARNMGIKNASGEYLSFVDSDDHVMDSSVYEKIYDYAIDNHADMISVNLMSYENGNYVNNRDCLNIYEEKVIKPQDYGIPWHHQKNIYKRSFILEHGILYPDYKRGQDPVFLANVLKNVDAIYCLPLNMYAYRKYEKYDKINSESKELDYIKHFHDVLNILDYESFRETHEKYQARMYKFLINPELYYSESSVKENLKKVFGENSPVLTIYELKKSLKENENNLKHFKLSSNYRYSSFPEMNYLIDSMIRYQNSTLNLDLDGKKLSLDTNLIVEELYKCQYMENIGRSKTQRLTSKFPVLYMIFNNSGGIKGLVKNIKGYKSIKRNNLFDTGYYLRMYPDIKIAGKDPLLHYMFYGFKEKRNPNALFDNEFYLNKYSDVKDLNISPLVHYVLFGKLENREVSPDPETRVVNVEQISDVAGIDNAIEIEFNRPIKPGTTWIELKNKKTKEPVEFEKKFFKNRIYLILLEQLSETEDYSLILHSECVTDLLNNPLNLYSTNLSLG
ncbi:MAG: glycosyltransferase family 2 protein [Methanobacterium sp.]|nr:glycosyltransferase family 2 protein [Methanobacterium sp.]